LYPGPDDRADALFGPVSEHRQDPLIDVLEELARTVVLAPSVQEVALEAAQLALGVIPRQA